MLRKNRSERDDQETELTEAEVIVRAQTLLERMTLEQKVGQMTMAERNWVTPDEVREYALGSVLCGGGSHPGDNDPTDWVAMNDAFWSALNDGENALQIPILFGIDAVHGHNNIRGATIFPHNIGLGAADDPELVAEMARVTAREILASGVEWNFAPTLAVVQNPHWGRTYESFGSDPGRAGRLGEAYVRALQGEGVMGCIKHWVGDGGTLYGMDQGETTLPWEELEALHISPYYPSLKAGVHSVMVSFNSWNGDKCHGHRYLVTEVLKEQLGFSGIVVSDWDGIDYLDEDYDRAVCQSINAGLDMIMVPERWREFIAALLRQVEAGNVPVSRIDDAVRRILATKIRIGLLDGPRPAERDLAYQSSFGGSEHREVARACVRASQVLLKNDEDLLPLSPDARVLVAGRNAHDLGAQCGGWTLSWQGDRGNDGVHGTTIWQGIKRIAPRATLDLDVTAVDPNLYDVAIVVAGENPYAEGFGDIRADDNLLVEAGSMIRGLTNPIEPYGRSLKLADLHPEDLACINELAGKRIPVVVVLVSGRPLVVEQELAASSAFVAAWLPGSEGMGVAEPLFGVTGYGGKLPMPWPSDRVVGKACYEAGLPEGFGLITEPRSLRVIDNVV
jgi:beta-glucosidase